ncbi:MAG TPA: ribosome maturation factor RimP [Jiangellaceae bacterium]|jgi:ribosome maturation factor RimP|nr:ribosome maturation factor RimP [Jiangellaceae bacterium]
MGFPSRDLLREIVEPLAAAHGVDLEDVEVTPAGRRRRVSVVVDADGGVDLDRCAEVSRAVSAALDESDVMGETPYTLEVSSPGVSRPLTMPRHWRRNVGRLVRLGLRDSGDLVGRIETADDTGVVLEIDGTARRLAYDAIGAARIQVEFRRTDEVEV